MNIINRLCLTFFIIVFILFTSVCTVFAEETAPLVKPVQKFNLPNGQTLIIKEVHTNPIVTIDTWVRTGTINEDDQNNGVAHFLEHLMFKGTEIHPTGEIDEVLESKGSFFNAGTSKDFTHFYITIASKHFDEALNLHSDMLLNANFPIDEINKERKVVIEEINRSEDDPGDQVYHNLNNLLYDTHPYRLETLGTRDVISNISRDKILEFYHKWYIPRNMVTIIVGDVDTDKVLKLVEQKFDGEPAKAMPFPVYKNEKQISKTEEVIKKGDYKQAYLELGFKAPSMKELEKTYALDVAANILGQGRSSRLYRRLKQEENLVNNLFTTNYTMKDDGVFLISFELQPENIEKVKKIVQEEIQNIKKDSVTQSELTKVKNQVAREFIYSNESVSNVASSMGYYATLGNLEDYLNYVDNIGGITTENVQNAVNEYLNTDKMVVSVLLPKKLEKLTNVPKENNVSKIKNSLDIKGQSAKENEVEKIVLPNGLTLLVKSNNANDVVSMNAYIKNGKLVQSRPGVASLVTNLLTKGTISRTANDIAKETENLGITLGAELADDYIQVEFKSTKNDFPEGFMVFSDILKNANFKEEEILKAKDSLKNSIKSSEDSPLDYSFENLYINIYPNHPYGQVGKVVLPELPLITRDEIVKYYKNNFAPENMIISVVGNIPIDIVKRYVEQTWAPKIGNSSKFDIPKVNEISAKKIVKIPKETEAAWISMGWYAPEVKSEDYFALKVINAVLGGGLSSRLSRNLREEKGMAYNVGSFYPSRKDKSVFVMFIGTHPKNINEVIKGFKSEAERLKNELISEEDLRKVKDKVIGNFALAQETNSQQAFYLGFYESEGVGYEFNGKYIDGVNKVTPEMVKAAANKIFDDRYVLSIVAPKKALDSYEE